MRRIPVRGSAWLTAMAGVGEGLRPGDPEWIGKYQVKGLLGEGGMGRVYLCLSEGGQRVAVKVIRADLADDPQFRARFWAEVTTAGKVSGAYTASFIEANLDGGLLWLATLYEGPSLREVVTRDGRLPARDVLALAAGLAEGLGAIHAAGVVHRDLKPSNVLLAENGPRIIDFGISRAVSESSTRTQTGTLFGTFGFMSPEQARGERVDKRSDVFSLGAVLAYAASGHGPFGTGEPPELLYRVVHEAPDLEDVPAEIRDLAGPCLEKEPGNRPALADLLTKLSWGGPLARVSAGARPAAEAAAPDQPDRRVRPVASAVWAPADARALAWAGASPRGSTLVLPQEPPGNEPGPSVWDRARHLRGRPLLVAAGAVVALVAVLVTAVVILTGGPGPFRPRLRSALTGPPSQGLTAVAFSPDNSLLAAAGNDGSSYVWTAAAGRLTATLPDPVSGGAAGLAFSPHGSLLATAGHDGTADLWTVPGATLARALREPADGSLTGVAFSPDGALLAAADSNGHTYLWTVTTGKLTATLSDPGSGGAADVAFSPDGALLATADSNGHTYLWTVTTGKLAAKLTDPHGTNVADAAFSPDGSLLATADGNGHTYVWAVATGKLIATLPDPGSGGVTGVGFSPDGTLMATADGNGSTYLWTTRS
jgi:Tol biopolymer transport system component